MLLDPVHRHLGEHVAAQVSDGALDSAQAHRNAVYRLQLQAHDITVAEVLAEPLGQPVPMRRQSARRMWGLNRVNSSCRQGATLSCRLTLPGQAAVSTGDLPLWLETCRPRPTLGHGWVPVFREDVAPDNPRMDALIRSAMVAVVAAVATLTAAAAPPVPEPMQVKATVHELDGHRVTLDVYPAVGPLRGAAILSHGFTRSRRTLAGHAQALADAGVLALTPDLPCTFDFRCNGRALAALVLSLRAGGTFGAPVERVMLVGFSAGGLSSLLAADTPGVVGFVGLDPFDRTMPDEAERLGLAAAGRLRTEVLLLRAPPSRCNAEAVAAPWGTALPALWRDDLIAGASHCDFESPTDWMCRLACGDTDPTRQQRVRQGLLDAAARWLR